MKKLLNFLLILSIPISKRISGAINLIHNPSRNEKIGPDRKVLEDLNFDCLICPKSSTCSHIAQLLNDFQLVIYPTEYHWEKDQQNHEHLIIDKTETKKNL